MKLFYMPGACSLASHIVLEWIGEPFEVVRVELGKTQDPEYLAINPLGKVPALVKDDGNLLVEASAILQYLADKYPAANLNYASNIDEQAELNKWLSHFGGNVHPAFFPYFVPGRYIQNSDLYDQVRETAFPRIAQNFEFLEEHMQGRDYVIAERKTILDPYLFVFLRWGNHLPKPLSDYPNLHRFYHQMAEDAGVKRALAEQRIGL